jgi:pimeloyl-ACP methyl ester carboxylesterase
VRTQGGWQNRVLARLSNELSRYNPIDKVPEVQAPVLMVAATRDSLCPVKVARRAAELNSNVKLLLKDAGAVVPGRSSRLSRRARGRVFFVRRLMASWKPPHFPAGGASHA